MNTAFADFVIADFVIAFALTMPLRKTFSINSVSLWVFRRAKLSEIWEKMPKKRAFFFSVRTNVAHLEKIVYFPSKISYLQPLGGVDSVWNRVYLLSIGC